MTKKRSPYRLRYASPPPNRVDENVSGPATKPPPTSGPGPGGATGKPRPSVSGKQNKGTGPRPQAMPPPRNMSDQGPMPPRRADVNELTQEQISNMKDIRQTEKWKQMNPHDTPRPNKLDQARINKLRKDKLEGTGDYGPGGKYHNAWKTNQERGQATTKAEMRARQAELDAANKDINMSNPYTQPGAGSNPPRDASLPGMRDAPQRDASLPGVSAGATNRPTPPRKGKTNKG